MRYVPPTPSRAFSVVELLVALAILVFGGYAVYGQFVAVGRQSRHRQTAIEARWLAHGEIERLRACSYEQLSRWRPPGQTVPMAEHPGFACRRELIRHSDGMLELTVQVGWGETDSDGAFASGRRAEACGVKMP